VSTEQEERATGEESPRPNAPNVGDHEEPMPEGEEAPPTGWRLMAVVRWVLVVAMGLAAALSVAHYFGWTAHAHAEQGKVVYYCPMHPGVQQDHPGECPICGMTLVPKTQGATSSAPSVPQMPPMAAASTSAAAKSDPYYCPMHPDQTSNDPNAKCPLCGMKMQPRPPLPKSVGASSSAMPITASSAMGAMQPAAAPFSSNLPGLVPIDLTFERVQLIGMKTAKATRAKLGTELHAVGIVAAPEGGIVKVNARVSGWIEQLFVTETGSAVKMGQPLAAIYSPQILIAEQELLNAKKWSAMPMDDAGVMPSVVGIDNDARSRLELLGVSKGEITAIEKEGKPRKTVMLYAPRAGYVLAKNAFQGLYFQPGSDLFTLGDLSKAWVFVDLFEYEAPRVGVGTEVKLTGAAIPGVEIAGKVAFLYPTLDPATRTLRARLDVPNKDMHLRPGMYVDATLALAGAEGIVVPIEAIVDTGEVQYVFVDKGGGHFEPRRVRVGMQTDESAQILDGVTEGESVVTTGNFLLDSESRLRATIESGEKPAAQGGQGSTCETDFDRAKFPDKFDQCRQCEIVHHGMGTMEEDCKNAIPKPWK